MSEETLRQELVSAFKARALVYYEVYRAASEELGPEQAETILRRAINRRGCASAQALKPFAPVDFHGLQKAFLGSIPDQGQLFEPEVIRCDAKGLDIKFHRCPLKEAWQEEGLSDDLTEKLCLIAGEVDKGMFEQAGFSFDSETWRAGADGCCSLFLRPAKTEAA